jgi:protein-tyrosine phosphatase
VGSAVFVDCHSHVIPSGDDGAQSVEEGIELCREAARSGTRILFGTPHVWPHYPLDEEREAAVRECFEAMRPRAQLELRLGWELTPAPPLLDEDPVRYALEGTDCILMEVPFAGPADLLWALAEHAEEADLRPVIAHPERTEAGQADPGLAVALAERGWLVQVNATSLVGRHGEVPQRLGWELVEGGHASLVGSDGHRAARPARIDQAYELARERLGEDALRLFDGSALGLGVSRRRPASRAASTGA